MNKKVILACFLACSALALTQCKHGGKKSENPSDSQSQGGETELKVELETGKTASQVGQLSFAADSESDEGEVVHIQYDEEEGKTVIFGLDAGNAKLTDGKIDYLVSVNYGIYKGTGEVSVGLGKDYMNLATLAAPFRGAKDDPYVAGTKNAFKVDAGLRYKTFTEVDDEWDLDEKVLPFDELNATHLYDTDNVHIEVSGPDGAVKYATINEDLTVSFEQAAVGQTVSVKAYANGQSVTQTVKVNEGYNIYNSDDFRFYFEDISIRGELNILRSFEAEVEDYQLYESHGQTYLYDTISDAEADIYQGSVYLRKDLSTNNEPLVVNGNYMILDATEVPQHLNGNAKDLDEATPVEWRGSTPFDFNSFRSTQANKINGLVCNPQEAIFRICGEKSGEQNKQVTFNNWNIRGNSNTGSEENPTFESTGEIDVIANSHKFTINNCILDFSVYGIAGYNSRSIIEVNDSIIQNSWGSSITTWKCQDVKVNNSLLKNAGSAAVWLINNEKTGEQGHLVIDEDSVIDNYLTATSAWFTAYGMSTLGSFTDDINGIVANFNHTIYNNTTDKAFNFEVLVQEANEEGRNNVPYATVSLNGLQSVIDPTSYNRDDYVTQANPARQYVKSVFSAKNSIIKALGQSDDELAMAIATKAQGSQTPSVVQQSYVASIAEFIMGQEQAGKLAHIQVDAVIPDQLGGLHPVGAVITIKPANA